MKKHIEQSSFRDPSGFLFYDGETLLRQVNICYKNDYDFLINSGLYTQLINDDLLIKHTEIKNHNGLTSDSYKVIQPEEVHFISYPYEWSFNQLKDAALVTLTIQMMALEHGMTLKDGSSYNIQFHNGKPVFIDTLSFEIYQDGKPWDAYRQFCQHFIAPLALMSYTDFRLNQILKINIDGIPLDLTSKLLPFRTRTKPSLLIHIHLHAKAQKKYENAGAVTKNITIKRSNMMALIHSLINTVHSLKIKDEATEWGEYYSIHNYNDKSFEDKKKIVTEYVHSIGPGMVWDLGANTGEFTQIAGRNGSICIAFDVDPLAVDLHYQNLKKQNIKNILPLIMDLTNPSPPIGWDSRERMGFKQRRLPDTILALALIHHLAISNNIPFHKIAKTFSELGNNLIIEFVPKMDSKVKKLLESRKDIFVNYDEDSFRRDFEAFYIIKERKKIIGSERLLYWMIRRQGKDT